MTLNQFRQALTKQHFRPFQIILADVRSFTIAHPEFVAMDPRGREVTFYEEDDTQNFIEAMLIYLTTCRVVRGLGSRNHGAGERSFTNSTHMLVSPRVHNEGIRPGRGAARRFGKPATGGQGKPRPRKSAWQIRRDGVSRTPQSVPVRTAGWGGTITTWGP
jgi:hypothetical protein